MSLWMPSGRCLWSHRGEVFVVGLKANVFMDAKWKVSLVS